MTDVLELLRRNRADITRLLGERWHLIDQARADGTSWARIGEALGMRDTSAHRWYYNTPESRRAQR